MKINIEIELDNDPTGTLVLGQVESTTDADETVGVSDAERVPPTDQVYLKAVAPLMISVSHLRGSVQHDLANPLIYGYSVTYGHLARALPAYERQLEQIETDRTATRAAIKSVINVITTILSNRDMR